MTTQPVGSAPGPASLPGGVTGYAGQPRTWGWQSPSMTPFAIAALTPTASCPAQEARRDLACWSGEL